MEPADALKAGLARLHLSAEEGQVAGLLRLLALIGKWNKVYNLTAIKDPREMLTHHLLDSLAVLPYLHGRRIIDVGTGAGLPGIPLAIMSPQREFVLLDSNNKKTRFVTQAVIELGLKNVTVQNLRVEEYRPGAPFDTVVSRAFASLAEMVQWTQALRAPQGVFLAMKGQLSAEELAALPAGFKIKEIAALQVPGLEAERHAIIIAAE
ncbi:MAG: 16S rRNA (guanine(527)-N(7))-methyltransferase RsmG [Pseudomonadota bacterium]